MADRRLNRVVSRLRNLPSISLPTDFPRPTGHRLVEAAHFAEFSEKTALSLLKLVLYSEQDLDEDDSTQTSIKRPSAFHLLLAAFTVLLHRYTADTDLVIGSSSASVREPLVLRLNVEPTDSFWTVVRRVEEVEKEAESDAVPFETITRALSDLSTDPSEKSRPLFRVRFFDETDEPKENFVRSTNLTSDLTIFVTRPPASTRSSLAPRISLRILYNSLLFTSDRISSIVDQLSALLRRVASNPLSPVGSVPLLTPNQRLSLPDPTADLNWCDWKGAIPDVFSHNARQFPDRPCVVQTIPAVNIADPQERMTYSYRTILRASNVLSHYLLQGGVQRGEVVMIYAHRSVELLVAVMAVLKAAAIFSVIGSYFHAAYFHLPS
jgi:L-2-aminoadipate reductase